MKILYITFCDLSSQANSGSTLRPQKMLEAFKGFGGEVRYVDGLQNNRKKRETAYKTVKHWLKKWKPDVCYIELPSGPLFFACDIFLIKMINRFGIPTGAFYRDAYWKYDDLFDQGNTSFVQLIKKNVIKIMAKMDLILFEKNIDIMYFPTEMMASYFNFSQMKALPPGCIKHAYKRIEHEGINVIYTGGATARYGVPKLIKAAHIVNRTEHIVNLYLVCPKDNWSNLLKDFSELNGIKDEEWLKIYHIGNGKELDDLYSISDIAIIPREKNDYHDFAFPIKLVDYLSHEIPIITTKCKATAEFIEEYEIGLVLKTDSTEEMAKEICELAYDEKRLEKYRENCRIAVEKNTWEKRAEKVIKELSSIE